MVIDHSRDLYLETKLCNYTLLFSWSPLTAIGYITYFPPWSSVGAHSGRLSGSCSAPKLCPSSWVVTRSASFFEHEKSNIEKNYSEQDRTEDSNYFQATSNSKIHWDGKGFSYEHFGGGWGVGVFCWLFFWVWFGFFVCWWFVVGFFFFEVENWRQVKLWSISKDKFQD